MFIMKQPTRLNLCPDPKTWLDRNRFQGLIPCCLEQESPGCQGSILQLNYRTNCWFQASHKLLLDTQSQAILESSLPVLLSDSVSSLVLTAPCSYNSTAPFQAVHNSFCWALPQVSHRLDIFYGRSLDGKYVQKGRFKHREVRVR